MMNLARVTVDEARARAIAIEHLDNPSWEPAVTEVEDAGDAWRVFYNSRAYVETGAVSHALAGNLPLLVAKETGAVETDFRFLPHGHPARPGDPGTVVSARLCSRIGRDFPSPGSAAEITRIVSEVSDTERVQAAIVLVANGDLTRFRSAVELARQDWRDVLVAADLADDDWPHRLFALLGPKR